MKSEEGNKATFSHWPRLDTLFATQAWISLRRLPEAKASKKSSFEGKMFEVCVFHRLKGCFCEKIPGSFRMIPVKTGEQPVKV